jgi:hypothetical protein
MEMEPLTGAGAIDANSLSDDIVWEVENIAKIIRQTDRQTYHLLATGKLPAKRIGSRWVASRRKLLDAILGDVA